MWPMIGVCKKMLYKGEGDDGGGGGGGGAFTPPMSDKFARCSPSALWDNLAW